MTNLGRVRRSNEDNFYFNGKFHDVDEDLSDYTATMNEKTDAALFAICDGMGGESFGDQAAYVAVSGLPEIERILRERPQVRLSEMANPYLIHTNDILCQQMRLNDGLRMGTTFSALLLREDTAQTVNLGDSRIYLVRSGRLYQLTRDHTHAQRLIDLGIITQEEGATHPERHRLIQHLGLFPEERHLTPSYSSQFWLQKDDILLLTSDGITDMVEADLLTKLIDLDLSLRRQAKVIMDAALESGGKDNATLILIRIDEVSPRDTRGIRETSKIVITPPQSPLNPEMTDDTKPIPVLPHYIYSSNLKKDGRDRNLAQTSADVEEARTNQKIETGRMRPREADAETSSVDEWRTGDSQANESGPDINQIVPGLFSEDMIDLTEGTPEADKSIAVRIKRQSEPPVIVRHTDHVTPRSADSARSPAQLDSDEPGPPPDPAGEETKAGEPETKDRQPAYSIKRVTLRNEAIIRERTTVVNTATLHKARDMVRKADQPKMFGKKTDRLADENEVSEMKKTNEGPTPFMQEPQRPIQRSDVRRPIKTDKNGLTPEDLERFQQAREAARLRQVEQEAGEARYMDAPVLPGHANRAPSYAQSPDERPMLNGDPAQTRQMSAVRKKTAGHDKRRASDKSAGQTRRRAAQPTRAERKKRVSTEGQRPDRQDPNRPVSQNSSVRGAGVTSGADRIQHYDPRRPDARPTSKEDLARRQLQHNVGREAPIVARRSAPEPLTDERGRRKRRKMGGFWRNLIFFIIFVAIGFLIGWILLNIGKYF